jgi:hypothetical protein
MLKGWCNKVVYSSVFRCFTGCRAGILSVVARYLRNILIIINLPIVDIDRWMPNDAVIESKSICNPKPSCKQSLRIYESANSGAAASRTVTYESLEEISVAISSRA